MTGGNAMACGRKQARSRRKETAGTTAGTAALVVMLLARAGSSWADSAAEGRPPAPARTPATTDAATTTATTSVPMAGLEPPAPRLFTPPLRRGTTILTVTLRPFFNLLGPGWGAVNDFAFEHYLARAPFKVSAVVAPLAIAVGSGATGMITHARVGGAFATDFIELGLTFGNRFQRFGRGGFSLAAGLRLGALDGLSVRVDLTHVIVRQYYTGELQVPFSGLQLTINVPLHPAMTLVAEAAFSFDSWLFMNLGAKHHLGPRGAPGTWTVRGGLGIAWVLDRFACQYGDPTPCEGTAAWATGLTFILGLDRRW